MSLKASLVLRLLAAGGLLVPAPIFADTISSNLASASAGVESATASNWLAASFTTSSSATLGEVILSLADTTSRGGTATVSVYADDGLNEPGSLLAALSSGSTLQTWISSGLSLSANSTYWIVLSAVTGQVDWSYASDDAGSGSGFTDTWAASYDGGSSWYTYASLQNVGVDPLQMDVETSTASTAATPEPASVAFCLIGAGLAAMSWRRRTKQEKAK